MSKYSKNESLSIEDGKKRLQKLTRKKHFSQHLAYGLYFASQPNESPLSKRYLSTVYCSTDLVPETGADGTLRLSSKRCRGRWCPVCQSILIAKMIQGYSAQLKALEEPYFVTLTAPTVSLSELPEQIAAFQKRWHDITRQRYWMKTKPKGIRKAECTIRPNGMYHYHWHIIIDGKASAEWLREQWLRRCQGADSHAQDIRPVNAGGYLEVFKYFTKLIAQDKSTGKRFIDFKRLDSVMVALHGKRIYQPFGGLKKVEEELHEEELQSVAVTEYYHKLWRWATGVGYIDPNTGEVLTGEYELPKWVEILTGGIDDKSEAEG